MWNGKFAWKIPYYDDYSAQSLGSKYFSLSEPMKYVSELQGLINVG